MRNAIVVVFLRLVAQARPGDTQDEADKVVSKLLFKLFERGLMVSHQQSTGLDSMTLGKPSHLAPQPHSNVKSSFQHRALPSRNDFSSLWGSATWGSRRPQLNGKEMHRQPQARAQTQTQPELQSRSVAQSQLQTQPKPQLDHGNAKDTKASGKSIQSLKWELLRMAAALDRGQAYNPTSGEYYAPRAEAARTLISTLVQQAPPLPTKLSAIDGDWELMYSTVKHGIFRSSPFFLAIQQAMGNREMSDLAFQLHELQTHQWGLSKIGRVAQTISSAEGRLYSEFDTTLLSMTTIPFVGTSKLLPTFGGSVVTASKVELVGDRLDMEVLYTEGRELPGLAGLPGFPPGVPSPLQNQKVPVGEIWQRLPWNNGKKPTCSVQLRYVDEDMRIVADNDGEFFVYTRPVDPREKVVRGPPELPVVQNAVDFIRYGGLSDMAAAMGKEYGSIALARNNDRDFFFLNDPELVKEVTVTQSQSFYNRLGAAQRNATNPGNASAGIVSATQEDHVRFRALANPFFFNKKLLKKYTSIVESDTIGAMAPWKPNSEVDIQPISKRITLSVISQISFSELRTEGDETVTLIRELLDVSGSLQRENQVSALLTKLGEPIDKFTESLPLDIPKIEKVVEPPSRQKVLDLGKKLRATEEKIINARRKQVEESRQAQDSEGGKGEKIANVPNDLLTVLLGSKEDETRPLTDGEIQTIIREMIIAGSDTTASSISATLFLLARDPERQRRVLRELDAVVGTNVSEPLTYDQIEKLPYLRLCIKETMRLYPAADVIFRTASETTHVGGYKIPEGAGVIISPVALGRNEQQWGSDAHLFRPERFEDLDPDGQPTFPRHSSAWLPFGAGPRGCIGSRLALMEATSACATVLRHWGLQAPTDAELKPRYSVTVDFEGGVNLKVVPRDLIL